MPELPDLQVFSKNIFSRVGNKTIREIAVYDKKKVNMPLAEIESAWVQKQIADITRIGKELYFHSTADGLFSVHLMLKGGFQICNANILNDVKFRIFSLTFCDDSALVISDPQRLAKVTFNPEDSVVPDALGESFSYDYFLDAVKRNARKNIKAFLIDQDIVKGIGNAYADEILWSANVSPESMTGKISEDYLLKIYNAIKEVLENAIESIVLLSPDIISGEERRFLKVHNPDREFTEDGDKILIKKIASKTTYYTEKQILFK